MAPVAPGSSVYCPSSNARNPGPGSYTDATLSIHPTQVGRTQKAMTAPGPMQTRVVHGIRTTPAIPRPHQSYGYTEGKNKKLELQNAPQLVYSGAAGDSVGPAFYNPSEFSTKHAQVTTNFGASNQTRQLFVPDKTSENWLPSHANPGPGHYNMNVTSGQDAMKSEVRPSSMFASKVPMAHEASADTASARPGPGSYTSNTGRITGSVKNPNAAQGFGSTQARVGWDRDMAAPFMTPTNQLAPGPGTYGEKRTAFNKQPRKRLTSEPIGFGATGSRPCMTQTDEAKGSVGAGAGPAGGAPPRLNQPGPGNYYSAGNEVGTLAGDVARKVVGPKGIFGSTTVRFVQGAFPLEEDPGSMLPISGPGPEVYFEEGVGRDTMAVPASKFARRRLPTSNFRSTAGRFPHETNAKPPPDAVIVGLTVGPAVGEYDLGSCFDNVTGKSGAPQASRLAKGKGGFGSSDHRFKQKEFMGMPMANRISNPGPGEYVEAVVEGFRPKPRRPRAPATNLATSSRFKSNTNTLPNNGPGAHDTAGEIVRKSYNITMRR
jgi:hypothetical protein